MFAGLVHFIAYLSPAIESNVAECRDAAGELCLMTCSASCHNHLAWQGPRPKAHMAVTSVAYNNNTTKERHQKELSRNQTGWRFDNCFCSVVRISELKHK